jgi:hypothetical protein
MTERRPWTHLPSALPAATVPAVAAAYVATGLALGARGAAATLPAALAAIGLIAVGTAGRPRARRHVAAVVVVTSATSSW